MDCISEGSDHILRSRIEDTVRLCSKRGSPCYLGFLDLREQATAQLLLRSLLVDENILFYGGFDDSERCLLAISPNYLPIFIEDFPLCAVGFRYRSQKKLTHRDVLGTLMSLGVRRDAVGDILCGDGLSVVFLRDEIAIYVCEQIDRIGGEGVTCVMNYDGPLPLSVEYESIKDTIASARLDVLVKTLTRSSRDDACEMIRIGNVSVNHIPCDSVSKTIVENTTISIRGYGRFIVDQIGPETKKGRLMLFARRRL